MRKKFTAGSLLFFLVCLCQNGQSKSMAASMAGEDYSVPAPKQSESRQQKGDPFMDVAKELSESAELPAGSKIAVMPFNYKNLKDSDVGKMVSERLTTRIVKVRKYKVIEREMLDNVMKELHLEGNGLVDADTAKKLGKVLGVEAIVTGTVLDLDQGMAEINARMITTETAEVVASSSAEIVNFWTPKAAPAIDNTHYSEPEPRPARILKRK